jgi:hypothetical protein
MLNAKTLEEPHITRRSCRFWLCQDSTFILSCIYALYYMDTIFGIDIVDLNCAWILSDATTRCCYRLSTTEVTVDLSQS